MVQAGSAVATESAEAGVAASAVVIAVVAAAAAALVGYLRGSGLGFLGSYFLVSFLSAYV